MLGIKCCDRCRILLRPRLFERDLCTDCFDDVYFPIERTAETLEKVKPHVCNISTDINVYPIPDIEPISDESTRT